MSKWNICHRADHVAKGADCTQVPYSDESLYDTSCHPYELRLVGLKPDTNDGDLPTHWICTAKGHNGTCKTPRSASQVREYNGSDHEWKHYYAPGEYILVALEVQDDYAGNCGTNLLVNSGVNKVYIPRKRILGLTEQPVPDEPARSVLLKSKKGGGELLTKQDGVWRIVGEDGSGFEWADVWTNWGPFETFVPSGAVLK